MKPLLIYCYDAYCEWCYGFSPIIRKISERFGSVFDFEVLSGGLILPPKPKHISALADHWLHTYKLVEAATGVAFGRDFLWHLQNPDESDWYPNSIKPAIALSVFKEYYPSRQIEFATDLEFALYAEGRDLDDNEAYRHLLEKYEIPADAFYSRLNSSEFKTEALGEFQTVKELGVSGYPAVFIQFDPGKILQLSAGYMSYVETEKMILDRLAEREV